ncbi:MAG: single-strand selective monofunctional uracil-DNA glycosylase [bacterium]|nr:single-strand selective monofunctional uracil-DNA glycosylase [bacterium]
MTIANELKQAAQELNKALKGLTFAPPVEVVYNPLEYASESHSLYLETYGNSTKKIIFMGMNPGPWGMAQTGVPFGEVEAVKGWLGIEARVGKPEPGHPKRPIEGFQCQRSEVSGRRLWGLFKERFGTAEQFFNDHFISNYCPLVFMEDSGRNRTPDKLKAGERQTLLAACDGHLRRVVKTLEPEWVIGVGRFARDRAGTALAGLDIQIGTILHPSPASPAANRDWSGTATAQLKELGIWS